MFGIKAIITLKLSTVIYALVKTKEKLVPAMGTAVAQLRAKRDTWQELFPGDTVR